MTSLLLGAGLLLVAWLAHDLLRDLLTLPMGAGPSRAAARVSVVVPARDEETTLPVLLASLRQLADPPAEVVVVDDGSTDATAAVARGAGATVLSVQGPPAGWTGKAWACHLAAQTAGGDRLLFLDADTRLAPTALEGLLTLHERYGGLVSVQPYHDVVEPYEQLSAYFNAVSLLASGAFARRAARRPMAFGPCLLTSREDYRRAGGHAAVRGEILDDVSLAGAYRRAGLPVRCAVGGSAVRMRMYPGGIRQLAEGWTKNFASGASAAAPWPTCVSVAWVAVHHAVAVGAGLTVLSAVGDVPGPALGAPVLWAVGYLGVAVQLRSFLRRIGSFTWWTWGVFPVALLAFDVLFARSVAVTVLRRSVRWRGRDVLVGSRAVSGDEPT